MLNDQLKEQLRSYLENLAQQVDITVLTDDSAKSREMMELLGEIKAMSPHISLIEKKDDPGRKPSFSMTRPGENTGVAFAGIPMGHEFTSFVLALLQTGGHAPKADPEIIEQIRSLRGKLHFETFVSLTCQNCPEVVQALNLMAVLNPDVSHVMIDGALFPEEAEKRGVMGVPTVFLNGREFSTGRMTVREILAIVDTGNLEREAKKMSEKPAFDILVIGGGAAAAAAAVYAARKGIRTGLVTENFGGQMLSTTTIENLITVREADGTKLAAQFEENVLAHGVDVMIPHRAVQLVPGDPIEIRTDSGASLKSRTVILAPGARYRQMSIPGEIEHIGRGVAFCAHCDGPLFKGKQVAVIGGGNAAIEAAIDLAGIAGHVTVLVRGERMEADLVLQDKLKLMQNVTIHQNAEASEVSGRDNRVSGLVYRDRNTGTEQRLDLEGVFVQIGQQPATEWLSGTVDLNGRGEIIVDDHARTSVPGVFAAGDATTAPFKQIVIALGSGATAALSAFDYLIRN